jgi:hypothetical protein
MRVCNVLLGRNCMIISLQRKEKRKRKKKRKKMRKEKCEKKYKKI